MEPGRNPLPTKKFPVSPLELGIFCIIALLFLNSVADLFYDVRGRPPAPATKTASDETAQGPGGESRSPASLKQQTYETVNLKCDSTLITAARPVIAEEVETQAKRVRLSGKICGVQNADEVRTVRTTEAVNRSNDYSATVFTDPSTTSFQTEYFTLNEGSNPLEVKFVFQSGKSTQQKITIFRGQKRKL